MSVVKFKLISTCDCHCCLQHDVVIATSRFSEYLTACFFDYMLDGVLLDSRIKGLRTQNFNGACRTANLAL